MNLKGIERAVARVGQLLILSEQIDRFTISVVAIDRNRPHLGRDIDIGLGSSGLSEEITEHRSIAICRCGRRYGLSTWEMR